MSNRAEITARTETTVALSVTLSDDAVGTIRQAYENNGAYPRVIVEYHAYGAYDGRYPRPVTLSPAVVRMIVEARP